MRRKTTLQITQEAYVARVADHHKALKDSRRIDWLAANDFPSFERWSTGWGLHVHEYDTLREAIDAEMGQDPAPPHPNLCRRCGAERVEYCPDCDNNSERICD